MLHFVSSLFGLLVQFRNRNGLLKMVKVDEFSKT